MPKLLVLFFSLLLNSVLGLADSLPRPPQEGFDAKAWGSIATYPLGGLLYANLGYGKKIWSSSNQLDSPDFWQYGYIRAAAELDTSVVTNRLGGEIEFYPISIFGLTAGGGFDSRNYRKFSGIDCNSLLCDQSVDFKFVRAQLVVGIEHFVLLASERYDWYRTDSHAQAFYDYMSYLVGRPGNDDLRSLTLLALYRYRPDLNFGALAWYQNMVESGSNNAAVYAVSNYTDGPWQATLGLGSYRSNFEAEHFSALFSLRYSFRRSIALIE